MTLARFTVTFDAKAPDALNVGDELTIAGNATVQKIDGQLIDITGYGGDTQYALGDLAINLFSTSVKVMPIGALDTRAEVAPVESRAPGATT